MATVSGPIYLSGPMTGLPEFNYPAFHEAARRWRAIGWDVINPAEHFEGRTDLFIHGNHPWRVVDVMLTNFHVPRSSLLVMVESFVGPRWRRLYETALDEGYRFLSFGDAMLLQRARGNR